jgi:hypothetical protein
MGNRETASNTLISISLTLPGEVAGPRMPGKPICHLSAWDSGYADGRAAQLLAETGGAGMAVTI